MSGPFFDTGVALKLVVREPLSDQAQAYVAKRRIAVPTTSLVELEMATAIQALAFRGEMTDEEAASALLLVEQLHREGKFHRVALSLDEMAAESLRLAPVVTSRTGCRTLDLLHIAAARLLGSSHFVSTDKRQLKAASLAGLQAVDLAKA